MNAASEIKWLEEVEDHDYHAAYNYLSLRFDKKRAKKALAKFRKSKITYRRANDILRASRLDPAPLSDPGVLKDIIKIAAGKKLSPILVVNFEVGCEIADGYHRTSLAYDLDPFSEIPLRLVDLV